MQTVAFGSATVNSGKNKGQAVTLAFSTGIKPENNTTGLPVSGDKVQLNVSPADILVPHFETADEVREAAGDNLGAFLVDAANERARYVARKDITSEARKLTLAPTNIVEWVQGIAARITHASIFVKDEKAAKGGSKPRGVKAELANLTAMANEMSKEDLLAAIAALASK